MYGDGIKTLGEKALSVRVCVCVCVCASTFVYKLVNWYTYGEVPIHVNTVRQEFLMSKI